jgi:WD40 repeat protein
LNGETGSFAFSPDGRLLARTVGRVAELYDAKTLLLLGTISDHSDHVFSLDFSADGKKLVTGGKDGTARMWELLDR